MTARSVAGRKLLFGTVADWRRSMEMLLKRESKVGSVQVFDGNKRTLLRQLKGHSQAVHVARFSLDRKHILTCGDDATVSQC